MGDEQGPDDPYAPSPLDGAALALLAAYKWHLATLLAAVYLSLKCGLIDPMGTFSAWRSEREWQKRQKAELDATRRRQLDEERARARAEQQELHAERAAVAAAREKERERVKRLEKQERALGPRKVGHRLGST